MEFYAEYGKIAVWNKQRRILVKDHLPLAGEIYAEVLIDQAKDSLKVLIMRK